MKAAILLASDHMRDQRTIRKLRVFLENIDETDLPEEDIAWLRLAIAAYGERSDAVELAN